MIITIYAGEKTTFIDGIGYRYYITCKNSNDTDTVYNGLAESIELKNPNKDIIDFENLKDDDVITLLQDTKKHGFIADYEIEKKQK